MNNIDILEELIRDYKDEKEFVGEEIIKAIENLIAENKELKERNKTMLSDEEKKEIEELKKDKLELINKHVVLLKDVEKELREMRKVIDTKNAEIECLNVIHESYKEMVEENNFISKDKIKAKIGKRMQKNNNTIHNAKLKHGKDYVYYDDVQEAKEENRICKEILQSLLEKE